MNRIKRIDEFKALIRDYKPSEEVVDLANRCRLLMLAGVSSSGRNSVIDELMKTGRYHHIVSDTTRRPRQNNGVDEEDGVEYFFKTEEDFIERLKQGKYLEAAIVHAQQVSGISVEELEILAADEKVGVTDMENVGTRKVQRIAKDTVAVFLIPPDFDTWMQRFAARAVLDQEEVKRRLESAESEIEDALMSNVFRFVINDDLEETARKVDEIVRGVEPQEGEIEEIKQTSWSLLNRLKQNIHS